MLLGRSPKYELRSAFSPGHIRGYVYLECSMNKYLVHLLLKIPGIIQTREGLIYQLIELNDRLKLLTLPKNKCLLGIGQWVRVLRGRYKGDVGLVCRTRAWGADVLLLPQLSSDLYTIPLPVATGKSKAKAYTMAADTDTDMNTNAVTDEDAEMDTDAEMDAEKDDGGRDLTTMKGNPRDKDSDMGKGAGQRKRKRNDGDAERHNM